MHIPVLQLPHLTFLTLHPIVSLPNGCLQPAVTLRPHPPTSAPLAGPFNLPSLTAGLNVQGESDPRLVIRGATVHTLTLAAGR